MKEKYIKFVLDRIFLEDSAYFKINNYFEENASRLTRLPIHQEVVDLMNKLYEHSKNTSYHGITLLVGKEFESDWFYSLFESYSVLQLINGNFNFQLALDGAKNGMPEQLRANCVVRDYKLSEVLIDHPHADFFIVKDGKSRI